MHMLHRIKETKNLSNKFVPSKERQADMIPGTIMQSQALHNKGWLCLPPLWVSCCLECTRSECVCFWFAGCGLRAIEVQKLASSSAHGAPRVLMLGEGTMPSSG